MALKRTGSLWNRGNRNAINDNWDTLDKLMSIIQALVVKGQLTTTQYASLLEAINGLVKKGDISVDDINKNYGKLDSTFFTTEFLEELNNGKITTTNVLPKTIGPAEILKDGVTEHQASFISKTRNLFDKNRLVHQKVLDRHGNLNDSNGVSTTDYFIEVFPGATYYKNIVGNILEYDKDKNAGQYYGYSDGQGAIKMQSTTRFVRLSVPTLQADELQFEQGSSPTNYVPYNSKLNRDLIYISGTEIETDSVPISVLSGFKKGKNLINKNNLRNAFMHPNTGEYTPHESNRATDYFISVKGDTLYTYSPFKKDKVTYITYYDSTKTFISSNRIDESSGNGIVRTPKNSAFAKVSFSVSEVDVAQFEEGNMATEYENYYNYHPNIVTALSSDSGGTSGVTQPNFVEISAPYDVRFSMPLGDGRYGSHRFSRNINGDDFMKGREQSILNNNLIVLYNITDAFSNKEFALSTSNGGSTFNWFPEHNGVSTANEGSIGHRKLTVDGEVVSLSNVLSIPRRFKKAVLTQKMELKLPGDSSPRAILTFIVTAENGELKESIRVEWKMSSLVNSGYVFMTPIDTQSFTGALMTSEFEYAKAKPNASELSTTTFNKVSANKYYFTSDSSGKTDVSLITEITKQSESNKELSFQHRSGTLEKLYPKQYSQTSKKAGDVDYFEGSYKIELLANANDVYKTN